MRHKVSVEAETARGTQRIGKNRKTKHEDDTHDVQTLIRWQYKQHKTTASAPAVRWRPGCCSRVWESAAGTWFLVKRRSSVSTGSGRWLKQTSEQTCRETQQIRWRYWTLHKELICIYKYKSVAGRRIYERVFRCNFHLRLQTGQRVLKWNVPNYCITMNDGSLSVASDYRRSRCVIGTSLDLWPCSNSIAAHSNTKSK